MENDRLKYESMFGLEISKKIDDEISRAVQFKRAGDFNKANDIYKKLNNQYPNNPIVLKSWAKISVCLGNYNQAIEKYKSASKLYKEFESGEYWQCDEQIKDIKNRYDDPELFKKWVYAVSGCSITNASLDSNDEDKTKKYDNLDNYPLNINETDPPDLEEIKDTLCKFIDSVKFSNEVIGGQLNSMMEHMLKYSDKPFSTDIDNSLDPLGNIKMMYSRWWHQSENNFTNNVDYLSNDWHKSGFMQGFYTIGSMLSEDNINLDYAILMFQMAVRIESSYFQCYMRIGDCYTKIGNYNHAIIHYKTALHVKELPGPKIGDGDYRAWCYLGIGICLLKSGNNDEGTAYVKKSKSIAVDNFTAYLLFGYASWSSLYSQYNIAED